MVNDNIGKSYTLWRMAKAEKCSVYNALYFLCPKKPAKSAFGVAYIIQVSVIIKYLLTS